jgi:carboxymethylenebutenolidase
MHQKIVDLYKEYVDGSLDRRDFLKRLACITGGTITAYATLTQLEANSAIAEIVPKNDPRPIRLGAPVEH